MKNAAHASASPVKIRLASSDRVFRAVTTVLLVILTLLAPAPVSESSQAMDAIFKEYDALPAEKK